MIIRNSRTRVKAKPSSAALGFVVLAAATITMSPVGPASADDADATSTELIAMIDQNDPSDLTAVAGDITGDGLSSVQDGDITIEIPFTGSEPVVMTTSFGEVSMTLSGADEAVAEIVGDSSAVFSNDEDVEVVAQAVDGGVRQVFVLSDASQAAISFDIDAGVGGSLVHEAGGISVQNADGDEIAAVIQPWATDANGTEVPTVYEINGTTVTQHINVTNATFPVVADPTLCGNKIDKVTFGNRDGGRTMFVRPTGCGRLWNGHSGWNEAQRESGQYYYGNRTIRCGTSTSATSTLPRGNPPGTSTNGAPTSATSRPSPRAATPDHY